MRGRRLSGADPGGARSACWRYGSGEDFPACAGGRRRCRHRHRSCRGRGGPGSGGAAGIPWPVGGGPEHGEPRLPKGRGPAHSYDLNHLGEYNASPALHETPSIREAMTRLLGDRAQVRYAPGCAVTGTDTSGFAAARAAARSADVAVVVVGEQTKGGYFSPDRTDGELKDVASLDLTGVQQRLLEEVHATGTPPVAVVVTGRALALPWATAHLPALLIAWLSGDAGGRAVAKVLFGETEPTGRLPVTFPRDVGQLPLSYDQKHARAEADDYVDLPSTPLHAFGSGRGWTTRPSRRTGGPRSTSTSRTRVTGPGPRSYSCTSPTTTRASRCRASGCGAWPNGGWRRASGSRCRSPWWPPGT
ncbi:glycoside hydrolase family 3 C-terminal domain-containing protein [Streptomyces sp. NPDC056660]|uniref:glycoside hydrolase family 3 protein n=1 Tax=Streptomyces sp. NPDC056660 TaxID=3345897 RepID=UPI0036C7DBB9